MKLKASKGLVSGTLFLILLLVDATKGYSSKVREKRQASFTSCPKKKASKDRKLLAKIIIYSPIDRTDVAIKTKESSWNKEDFDVLLKNGFNLSQPTLLFSHAYIQNSKAPWLVDMRKKYDEMFPSNIKPTFNMLFHDWSDISMQFYGTSASYVPRVGKTLGKFLGQFSETYSYDLSKVHVIGFSLSTHVAGVAGRTLAKYNKKLGLITAIDSTGVCFHDNSKFGNQTKLRSSDAELVVARHYDLNSLGSHEPIGGLDIYVNGGRKQPSIYRSKREVYETEEEDLGLNVGGMNSHCKGSLHETQFGSANCGSVAYSCHSYDAWLGGACASCGDENQNCYHLDNLRALKLQLEGVKTRSDSYPAGSVMYIQSGREQICLHHYQIVARLKENTKGDSSNFLASSQIRFALEANLSARPFYPMNDERSFSTLLTTKNPLKNLEYVTVAGKTSMVMEVLAAIEILEINMMSSPLKEERDAGSMRFCPTEMSIASQTLSRC